MTILKKIQADTVQMKKKSILLVTFCCLALMPFKIDTIIDYLSVGSLLKFENENYNLTWSSHPNETYYKQEYLKTTDNKLESYEKMIKSVNTIKYPKVQAK